MPVGNPFAALSDFSDLARLLDSKREELEQRAQQAGSSKRRQEPQNRQEADATAVASGEASTSGARQSDDGEDKWAEARSRYKLRNPIVWMDLEMTGLDPDTHHILEIAVLITEGDLSGAPLEGPDLAIHQPEAVLAGMNEWCVENHGRSGLTQRCRDSGVSLAQAEEQVLAFLQRHTQPMAEVGPPELKAHLAGNSIYVDRAFLQKYMPRVHAHLHWRLIDVSTLLELCRRWYPAEFRRAPRKKVMHTAMADIRESVAELKYYRRAIFKDPSKQQGEATPIRRGRR